MTQQLRALQSGGKESKEITLPVLVEANPVAAEPVAESSKQPESKVSEDTSAPKEEPSKEDTFPSLEILRYKKKLGEYGGFKLVKDAGTNEKDQAKDMTGKHVLRVMREFASNKVFWRTLIEIFSPDLQRLLRQVPDFIARLNPVDDIYSLTEPFLDLFLNRKALTDAVQNQDIDSTDSGLVQARSHVELILNFLRTDFPDLSRKLDDLESDNPSNLITFPELCLLYKPGTIVYSTENGEQEAFMVDSVRGMNRRQRKNTTRFSHGRLDLTCWSIDYDGEAFGRVWSMQCIAPFDGTREISSLNLVPEKFMPNAAEVRQSLLTRGRNFWSLQGQQCHEYIGELYSQHTNEEATRVMIDHLTYQRRNQWPISINKKRGPSDAMNKNWKDDRFGRGKSGCHDDCCDFISRPCRGTAPPGEDTSEEEFDDGQGGRGDGMGMDPYRRFNYEYAPPSLISKYEKYDLLDASAEPDELALLVSPQYVHGFCLREKVWSKWIP